MRSSFPMWPALALIVACGGEDTLAGTWEGTCDLQSSGPEHYDLTLYLTEDGDGGASGQATVEPDWFVGSVLGTARGVLIDDQVEIDAALGDLSMNFTLALQGTLKRDRIEGTCASGEAEGVGELVRTADAEEEPEETGDAPADP